MFRVLLVLALLGIALSGCSSSTAPETPEETVLPPNPDGMLLPGNETDGALGAVVSLTPTPVSPEAIRDGLLTTRIRAVIDPDATVGQLNQALEDLDAAIVSMRSGLPTVVLVINAVADEDEAAARARAVAASDAFLAAFPGRTFGRSGAPANASPGVTAASEIPGGWDENEETPFIHLDTMVFPQAWTFRPLDQDRVTVVLADEFVFRTEHPEVPGLDEPDTETLSGIPARDELTLDGTRFLGNRGYHHAGIIGAGWEGSALVGVHPDASIMGIPIGMLDMSEVLIEIAIEMEQVEGPLVLVTPFNFSHEPLGPIPMESAMLAAQWLRHLRQSNLENRTLHVASAGETGQLDAVYQVSHTTAPWNLAASYQTLTTYLEENFATVQDIADFVEYEQLLRLGLNYATDPLDNVLIVGATDDFGEPLPTSSLLPHLYAPGVRIPGPCQDADPGLGADPGLCDGDQAQYSGTGPAAALVGGVASYLWDLAPERSATGIRDAVLYGYTRGAAFGAVDAYHAVLWLDPGLEDARARETLLDVTGDADDYPNLDAPNDLFNEKDLKVFTDRFAVVGGLPGFLDDLRFDLNGDGFVGSTAESAFDLDADRILGTVTLNVGGDDETLDEGALSDLDILCYYAYSDLYFGDEEARDVLLAECGNREGLFVEILDVPDRVSAGDRVEIRVRAGLNDGNGGVTYPAGVEISMEGNGVQTTVPDGTTNPLGIFTTTVVFGGSDNVMVVGAWAEFGDEEVYTEQPVLRHNEIEIVSSEAFAYVDLLGAYQAEAGIPSTRVIWEGFLHNESDFSEVDTTISEARAGTGAGIQYSGSGEIEAEAEARVDDDRLQVSYTARSQASITLENPNFDVLSYQADADAGFEIEVDFIVWGDPATFTLSGFMDAREYEVELEGDDDVFECEEEDNPCPTLGESGTLPPDRYDFSVYLHSEGHIRWFEGCDDCTLSGTQSGSGQGSVTLEVAH